MRVLIVDDDPVSREFAKQALAITSHEVLTAENGVDAWGMYDLWNIDVMIVDALMPEMDGFELCRRVRAAHREAYTYIVMLTSLQGSDDYLAGIDAGVDDFVSKPVGARELAARLRVAERILGLQARVRRLETLLPICAWCKRIRDDGNAWVDVESYIAKQTDATFTHGICPSCAATMAAEEV